MAHEYGHAIGLPELYDRTNRFESNTDYDNHSAGHWLLRRDGQREQWIRREEGGCCRRAQLLYLSGRG